MFKFISPFSAGQLDDPFAPPKLPHGLEMKVAVVSCAHGDCNKLECENCKSKSIAQYITSRADAKEVVDKKCPLSQPQTSTSAQSSE